MIPGWLRQKIAGKCHAEPCPRCRAVLLVGDSEGWPAKVDPVALDVGQQILARLAGLNLHHVEHRDGRLELFPRTAWRVADPTLDTLPVVADHRCGNRWQGADLLNPTTRHHPLPDRCPF